MFRKDNFTFFKASGSQFAFPSIHKRVNWINAYKNVIGKMADNERRALQAVSG